MQHMPNKITIERILLTFLTASVSSRTFSDMVDYDLGECGGKRNKGLIRVEKGFEEAARFDSGRIIGD